MSRIFFSVVAISLVQVALAEDSKKDPQAAVKAMVEAATPSSEHRKLEPLVGSWTYVCKAWMDPSKPAMETTGTIERKWILGKRFIEEKVSGTNFDGSPGFEGIGTIGYDNAQKKFTNSWICTMCTGSSSGLGKSDDAGKEFTFETEGFCPIEKKLIKGREELKIESPDKTVMTSYHMVDGKEVKAMEIVAIRRR